MTVVVSIVEWEALTELPISSLIFDHEKGSIYTVVKLGFLLAKNAIDYNEKIHKQYDYLPTITVSLSGRNQMFRLPISLSVWAFDQIALVRSGEIKFPTEIEFGILNGRMYAEYVL